MKKLGKICITALPFIVMILFILVPFVSNIYKSFSGEDSSFVGLANYMNLDISSSVIKSIVSNFLMKILIFILGGLFVFCGTLGIGSVKNKWIRMLLLFAVSTNFAASDTALGSLFIILSAFLFPEKTGIRHAWHLTLIFTVIYFAFTNLIPTPVTAYASMLTGNAGGLYAILTIKAFIAVMLGIVGSIILLKLKEKSYAEKKIVRMNGLGNIYIILYAVICIASIIYSIISSEQFSITPIPLYVIAVCIAVLLITIVTIILSMSLAYSMDKKAIFIIVCLITVLNLNERYYYMFLSIQYPATILTITTQVKYMMIIALIVSVLGKGRTIIKNIPAMIAIISPILLVSVRSSAILNEWEIISLMNTQETISETFDSYVYEMGRIGNVDVETIFSIAVFILICAGIAAATALLKKEEQQKVEP